MSKPKATPVFPLVGKKINSNSISIVPNILVIRKGVDKKHLRSYCNKYNFNYSKCNFIAFVSSPYMFTNSFVRDKVELWLHPFKKPLDYLPCDKPMYFISESDFVDPLNYRQIPKKRIKWDFCYFLVGGDDGINHKGYNDFKTIIKSFSHLRGIIVVYGKANKFPQSEKKLLTKYGFKILTKALDTDRMQKIYSSVNFGLFPNIIDCSPRIISECLIHDTPILVNKKILGGWKYVNANTGMFFDLEISKEDIDAFINKKYKPRHEFMKNFGFLNSSTRLAKILSEHYSYIKSYSMLYLSSHSDLLKKYL